MSCSPVFLTLFPQTPMVVALFIQTQVFYYFVRTKPNVYRFAATNRSVYHAVHADLRLSHQLLAWSTQFHIPSVVSLV